MPTLGISYHLGVDGISLLLVLLTTFLMPLTLLSSWHSIEKRWKEFAVTMLLLETGMLGVFVALDLFLFYVFWEAMLIPMYLIIGIWGGDEPRLRGGEVRALHPGRLPADAGRHPGAVLPARRRHRQLHLRPARARPVRAAGRADPESPLPRLRAGLRHQGADVPLPHLAARRARGGAHAGQRDPRRRAPEDGDLRLSALLPAALPAGEPHLRALGDRPGRDRHHLRGVGVHRAGRHQEAGGLLQREPPGLRDAGRVRPQSPRASWAASSRW